MANVLAWRHQWTPENLYSLRNSYHPGWAPSTEMWVVMLVGGWQYDHINRVLLLRHEHLELRMLLKLEIPIHWLLVFDRLQVMLLLLMVPTGCWAAKPMGGARGRDSSPFDLHFLPRFRLHTLQIECTYTTARKKKCSESSKTWSEFDLCQTQ